MSQSQLKPARTLCTTSGSFIAHVGLTSHYSVMITAAVVETTIFNVCRYETMLTVYSRVESTLGPLLNVLHPRFAALRFLDDLSFL